MIRLNKFIAAAAKISRRKADSLIKKKLISLNGQIVDNLATQVNPQTDEVKLADRLLVNPNNYIYLAFCKPRGIICTLNDTHDRKTIIDFIPKNLGLYPVGRLDKNSSGLLLLTNDGQFAFKLTHPKFIKEKEYLVEIKGELQKSDQAKIIAGLKLPAFTLSPAKLTVLKASQIRTRLTLTIHEGKKRQIRELFSYLNHPVTHLKRIRIASLKLENLEPGQWRHLTPDEVKKLMAE